MSIKRITAALEASPMYNLSLSSKELFHSNFLAWLGNNLTTKPFFESIINQLTNISLNQYPNWIVEREDKNFDLCIKDGKDYILVIENKVKSIPRKDQLDEYYNKKTGKRRPQYVLLSLVTVFPDRQDIQNQGRWSILSYADLAQIMRNNVGLVKDQYESLIISDYICFIDNLAQLEQQWQGLIGQSGFAEKAIWNPVLDRMQDLYRKIQFSTYSTLISQKLQKVLGSYGIVLYNSNILKKNKKNPLITVDPQKLYVDVHWGYSNRGHKGVLDVAIPVSNLANPQIIRGTVYPNSYIKFQVEDTNYRHVLETTNSNAVGQGLINIGKDTTLYSSNKSELDFFSTDPLNRNLPLPNYGANNIFMKKLKPVRQKQIGSNWPFASFGNGFIYQSMDIIKGASVNDVLDNIVNEVARIFKKLPIV